MFRSRNTSKFNVVLVRTIEASDELPARFGAVFCVVYV